MKKHITPSTLIAFLLGILLSGTVYHLIDALHELIYFIFNV